MSLIIGYLPVCDALPFFVAYDQGFFRDHGLSVELKEFSTGNSIISASLTGRLIGGLIGSIPLLFAARKNRLLRLLADGGHINPQISCYFGIIARKDSGIERMSDLRKKQVAINGYNTNSDILLRLAGRQAGILESINIVTMPMWTMVDSLEKKLIDAAVTCEPYISMGIKKNKIKVIIDSNEIIPEFQSSFICINKDIKNEGIIDKLKITYETSVDFIMNNPDPSRQILSKWTSIDADLAKSVILPKWDLASDLEENFKRTDKILSEFHIEEKGRIRVNKLNVTYEADNPVPAVQDMTFEVAPGEFVCLLGTSGCGKSTILNAIAGFIRPSGGEILLDGDPVERSSREKGIVFQSHALFPWKTVISNVEFGLKMKGISKGNRAKIAQFYLTLVGLRGYESNYPTELSGGMEQRVGIARVLANDPLIILMDEPFGALDAQTRQMMQELLLKIWDEYNKTIIFVTHDVDEAIFLADRLLVLTARPARVKKEICIKLARPRNYNVLLSPDFIRIKEEVIELIREETLKTINLKAELQ